MTTRSFSAKTTLAFWLSALAALAFGVLPAPGVSSGAQERKSAAAPRKVAAPQPQPNDLAALARAYRAAPSPARRAALETYAAAHAKDASGPLAHLALGIASYEHADYRAALAALRAAKVPELADYAGYYLAAARLEARDYAGIGGDLAPTHAAEPLSPFAGRAWLLEAQALKPEAASAAASLLRAHSAELPQPDGDLTLAECYWAANDRTEAAAYYQRVYYGYVSGDASARAAAALAELRRALRAAYPEAPAPVRLQRADRLLEAGEYARARAEYRSVAAATTGLEHEQALVRVGAAEYLAGESHAAYLYLRGLLLSAIQADAERLYYLAECARRLANDDEMRGAVGKLTAGYPKSPWRFKALVTAANRYLLVHQPGDYVPLYQAAYQDFPGEPGAPLCHWKVAFEAWMRNPEGAADLLREHLREYPRHATAGAALYFLGRTAEGRGDWASAKAIYRRLALAFQNTYYAVLARGRLTRAEIAAAPPSEKTAAFLAGLALPAVPPVPAEPTRATAMRIARARLLRACGLSDLADSELRFGARTDGQAPLLAMEAAASAAAPSDGMRFMKSLDPDYLSLPFDQAPRQFWEYLFPLPYRDDLVRDARAQDLDPYLIAGLVREESEFDPRALSRAHAYGLAQIRPATGRLFAKQAGIGRFTNRQLFQPALNLMLGATVLRHMLDQNGGRIEAALAAYNAGPNRAAEWLRWGSFREPAEFIESIPFADTRDYVQAVLRNAEMYRRLYAP